MSLNLRAALGVGILAAVMALVIFVAAGTVRYWQGWVYLAVFFGASIPITVYLLGHDRALLERRLSGGPFAEKIVAQRIIMLFTSIGFIALLVVPAVDYRLGYRLGWSQVPLIVEVCGLVLVALGFYAIFRVYQENTYTAATIRVEQGQRVISTGPYALVRHPMYGASLAMLLGVPLALGSYLGLLALAAILPFLIWRLFDEERFLARNLPGYSDYQQEVRWRLVPGLF